MLVAERMEFAQLKPEMITDPLRQEVSNLEMQLYARNRDLAKWQSLNVSALRAKEIDSRWEATAKQQRKEELGRAMFDIEMLEIALSHTLGELAYWEALGVAAKEESMNDDEPVETPEPEEPPTDPEPDDDDGADS